MNSRSPSLLSGLQYPTDLSATGGKMTTAIGVVVTEHIVAGKLEDMRLVGETVRYPEKDDVMEALTAVPGSELVDLLAGQIVSVAGKKPVDAIGVAVPGVVRQGVVEESPN